MNWVVLLLAGLMLVSAHTATAQQRHLQGYDAWVTTPACLSAPISSNQQKDSMGRLWGYERSKSCAFKDEQQQPLFPDSSTSLQTWDSAPACGTDAPPNAENSAPDKMHRDRKSVV